jgi:ABC-2 type transport system ATP-binding protein
MDEADRLCDRIAIIDHGKIAALGAPGDLKKDLGGDVIRIRTKNDIASAIRDMDSVKNIQVAGEEVSITVRDASANLQEILRRVGKVDSVEVRPLTLEDVFLHFTGKAIREGAPEGGWAEKAMHAGSGR